MSAIGQKPPKQTKANERRAYELATVRDQNTCQRCLRNCGPIARDHRQNRDGRNTVPSNLQLLGLQCHQWKTGHPRDALRDGWAMPRHTLLSPAEWPARRWLPTHRGTVRLGWVLYDETGDWTEISDEEARKRMKGAA